MNERSRLTTDPQHELFPVVNVHDMVIGSITRKEAHRCPDIIHRVAGVFIFNPLGHVLLTKRSMTKDTFPGCWDVSMGGHVNFGDEYLPTAIRESKEELGLQLEPSDLSPSGK